MRNPACASRRATIRSLSGDFRAAIHRTCHVLARLSPDFRHFPRGSCSSACFLLGRWLTENRHRDFDYVSLNDGTCSHVWLQNDDLVVDITGDQFGPPVPPVFVVGYEGARGRCGGRAVELIHSIHRLDHPLPRTPTPFYRRLFLTKRGRLTTNGLHLNLPLELSNRTGPPQPARSRRTRLGRRAGAAVVGGEAEGQHEAHRGRPARAQPAHAAR